jgi:imidazolonepropionase-like amidohydrolase
MRQHSRTRRVLLCCLAIFCAALSELAAADITLIRASRVLADASKPVLGPTTIVIRDGRIVELMPGRAAQPRQRAPEERITELDMGERLVLPGLIDSHVHLQEAKYEEPWWRVAVLTDEYRVARALYHAGITVRAGFTTVRDLGSGPRVMFAVRDAVRDGIAVGPRILAAGPGISIVGGHGTESGFSPQVNEALDEHNTCTGADECMRRVRELSQSGADLIKILVTGGVNSQQGRGLGQHFTTAELAAITEAAHLLGLKVACHAHGPRAVEVAAQVGCASIEHAVFADDAALKEMAKRGAYLVPTLSTTTLYRERIGTGFYTPAVEEKIKQRLEMTGKSIVAGRRLGVKIAFGTDAGFYHPGRNAGELALMVRYGEMSARDALVAATINAADLLGVADEVGTLAPGKSADLLAVDGDPLSDVSAMEKTGFVMARGVIVRDDRAR